MLFAGRSVSFPFYETAFRGEKISIDQRIADRTPFAEVYHFERTAKHNGINRHLKDDPRVLIVPPLSGHFATLINGTIEAMLPTHDVYVVSWNDAKTIPVVKGYFDLEDQIAFLVGVIQKLGPNTHILSIGQASPAMLCAVSIMAANEDVAQPRSLSMIGGPIDPHATRCALADMARNRPLSWFRETQIHYVPFYYAGAIRRVYPGMMQLSDRMALTLGVDQREQKNYFNHLVRGDDDTKESHEILYRQFQHVMDVPEELHLQMIERIYQANALARGAFTWRGQVVDPSAIKSTAILTIEGELDDCSPPGQTRAALDLCTGLPAKMKLAHVEIGVRHFALFTGRTWRNTIQPVIHGFIREHEKV